MQVTQIKTIQNQSVDAQTRYKISLFDGETHHSFGILATQKNHLIENGDLQVGSVIELTDYQPNVLSQEPKKVVIILVEVDVLGDMEVESTANDTQKKVINNENKEPIKQQQIYQKKIESPDKQESMTSAKPVSKSFYGDKPKQQQDYPSKLAQKSQSTGASAPGMFNGFKVFDIASLNPYQNKWSIKARCVNKSNIRTWSNSRGEGKLFSVDLVDASGEIRASGFNEQCEKYYDYFQIDKVYYISKAQLKTANKQYNTLNNDYEMTLNGESSIEECTDDSDTLIPRLSLNLIPISEISNKQANDIIDMIGVLKSAGDCATIIARASNKEMKKRDIILMDNSNCCISVTLWGKQAEDFDANDNPIVLLKGVKVGDYNGRTVSVLNNSIFQLNPDIPEAHTLRGWFDQGGSSIDLNDLSGGRANADGLVGGNSGGTGLQANWKSLDSLREEQLGMGDKADYLTSHAVILFAKKENSMYMACPSENCNKKVIDQNDGSYRCEKCGKDFDKFKWRMILQLNIADHTDAQWITCFQESSEMVLGMPADNIGEYKQSVKLSN